MFYNSREDKIQLDHTSMNYVVFGKGKKNLVIIPGLNFTGVKGHHIDLAFMHSLYTKEYRVYLFDPIHPMPNTYSIEQMANDLAKALVKLQISSTDVIGISMGGMIAQYLALNHPYLVHKLVLVVTLSRKNPTIEANINHWINLAEEGDYKTLLKDSFGKKYSEEYVKKYKWLLSFLTSTMKRISLNRFIKHAKACLTCNTYERLQEIKCPVYVIGGKKDQVVTYEGTNEISDLLQCESYYYAQYGHSLYEEAKDYHKRVLEFLRK